MQRKTIAALVFAVLGCGAAGAYWQGTGPDDTPRDASAPAVWSLATDWAREAYATAQGVAGEWQQAEPEPHVLLLTGLGVVLWVAARRRPE
ncbi:hypothetical protein [Caldimonas brevitalea]|uniref:PEP-CTERM protein-sorting domain-containing protein n=1 Tax=Caldimonas brevitalea TaxID=413882 RepID=A0A0G3BRM2_9BURK|nr:hypothetical protein [Caldimonas brevitalea]AKJ30021.1 hypothetical protein AAW51_3330 [Caldimonas brevitalea]